MAKNRKFFFCLFSLIMISQARKRVFWCSLRSHSFLLSAARPKNKKKYAARSTQIFQSFDLTEKGTRSSESFFSEAFSVFSFVINLFYHRKSSKEKPKEYQKNTF